MRSCARSTGPPTGWAECFAIPRSPCPSASSPSARGASEPSSALLPPLGEEVFHVALGIARGERVVLRLDAEARRRPEVLLGQSPRPFFIELEGERGVACELAGQGQGFAAEPGRRDHLAGESGLEG